MNNCGTKSTDNWYNWYRAANTGIGEQVYPLQARLVIKGGAEAVRQLQGEDLGRVCIHNPAGSQYVDCERCFPPTITAVRSRRRLARLTIRGLLLVANLVSYVQKFCYRTSLRLAK